MYIQRLKPSLAPSMPRMRQEADRSHTAQGTVIWETKGTGSPWDKNNERWGEGGKNPQSDSGFTDPKGNYLLSQIRG